MNRGLLLLALAFVSGWLAAVVSSQQLSAQQTPGESCHSVSKIEYDAAQADHVLISDSGLYLQTGQFWRRHYWYCFE
jgi:hypothetical protein